MELTLGNIRAETINGKVGWKELLRHAGITGAIGQIIQQLKRIEADLADNIDDISNQESQSKWNYVVYVSTLITAAWEGLESFETDIPALANETSWDNTWGEPTALDHDLCAYPILTGIKMDLVRLQAFMADTRCLGQEFIEKDDASLGSAYTTKASLGYYLAMKHVHNMLAAIIRSLREIKVSMGADVCIDRQITIDNPGRRGGL